MVGPENEKKEKPEWIYKEKTNFKKQNIPYKIIDLVLADVKIVFEEPVAKRNGPGFEAPKFAFIVKNMTETANKIKALLE